MYTRILGAVYGQPWAILPDVHEAIQQALQQAIAGGPQSRTQAVAQIPFTPIATAAGLQPYPAQGSRMWTKGPLAVIPVRGVIGSKLSSLETMCGGYDVAQFVRDVNFAGNDPKIRRVMVDFHSPGGSVVGMPESSLEFRSLGAVKDTIGFTDGMSASGSYWWMSQAKHIYMTESASVGSVGVYVAHVNRTKELESKGVSVEVFKAGKFKAMGMGAPLSEEERGLIQGRVDQVYERFTGMVTKSRPQVKSPSMQGQMFSGPEAVKAGLADALVRSFDSLVRRLS